MLAVPSMVAMCSLSNSKIRLFLILKIILFEKVNNFILLTKYFSLFCVCFFFIRSDNILSCHMVMLQCAPPTGHVVTFHFHRLRVNKEKHIHCIMCESVKLLWINLNPMWIYTN